MKCAILSLLMAVILTGCTADTQQPTTEPVNFEISPSIDTIFINKPVDFKLLDSVTGEPVERPSWRIVSLHNVPGDRGIIRSDGRYTAPRIAPYPPTVQIEGRSEGRRVSAEFLIVNPDWPPGGTPRPGDGHTHPVHGIPEFKTSRPIDDGLPAGESVRITPLDRTGRPLLVSHYEVKHRNRVVSFAGSITSDGVYTAPASVPGPWLDVQIYVLYWFEGGSPGQISLSGRTIKVVP